MCCQVTRNEKAHWQIKPAKLCRVFPKSSSTEQVEPKPTPLENQQKTSQNSDLEVGVEMLCEQIDRMDTERERERAQFTDQIEALREQAERQSADHRQALAALTDQREREPRRRFWARLFGF